jgi:hypothetical protein
MNRYAVTVRRHGRESTIYVWAKNRGDAREFAVANHPTIDRVLYVQEITERSYWLMSGGDAA